MKIREPEAWARLALSQKITVLVYVSAQYVFLLAMPLALLAAVFDVRAAGYLIIVAVTFHIVGRQLAVREFADREDEVDGPTAERTASLFGTGCMLLMTGALLAALAGWQAGAYVAVAALIGLLASHVVLGGLAYRRVMTRPWPDVPPVAEDDDDDW